MSGAEGFWADESREIGLVCDDHGMVIEADARARRVLGINPPEKLERFVAPGTEAKLHELMRRASQDLVRSWELPLICGGSPCVFLVDAVTRDGRTFILAARQPEKYATALKQGSDALQEIVELNREIARQKRELEEQKRQLERAYSDLDESHRGVVTLHGELEDKAATLQRAADVKTRVVANVSHEFRTPLHSILGLSKLLLDGVDGLLSDEQQKQVRYIRSSAEELSELVSDMLDLSRAETGRVQVRPQSFRLVPFLSAMRGMLIPLSSPAAGVELLFDAPTAGSDEDIELDTDQGKIAQILRNLVSNALKFTERGSVRVTARRAPDDHIAFVVTDTGIGIPQEAHGLVFEEFGQVDNHLQENARGAGLGLPLSRRLAEILGGSLTMVSEPGKGSTFTLTVPRVHPEERDLVQMVKRPVDPALSQVLVLEDDRKTIFIYEKYLAMAGFQVMPARTVDEARALLKTMRPGAIVLDIMLEGETSWKFLSELKSDPKTSDIPTLVVTVGSQQQKARALGADEFWLKPLDQDRLIRKLKAVTRPGAETRVLLIDDDEKFIYYTKKLLEKTSFVMTSALSGPEGVRLAQELRPNVIFLDFLLRDVTAFDVMDELKSDPRTRNIPVIIVTSHALDEQERGRLAREVEAIVPKDQLSRELAINRIRDALRAAGVGSSPDGNRSES